MTFVFALFNIRPDMSLNLLIIRRKALRDTILLEMTVVSSANCVSFASCELGSLIPLQSLSCRSLIAKFMFVKYLWLFVGAN